MLCTEFIPNVRRVCCSCEQSVSQQCCSEDSTTSVQKCKLRSAGGELQVATSLAATQKTILRDYSVHARAACVRCTRQPSATIRVIRGLASSCAAVRNWSLKRVRCGSGRMWYLVHACGAYNYIKTVTPIHGLAGQACRALWIESALRRM